MDKDESHLIEILEHLDVDSISCLLRESVSDELVKICLWLALKLSLLGALVVEGSLTAAGF
jgi:hypothetical protein